MEPSDTLLTKIIDLLAEQEKSVCYCAGFELGKWRLRGLDEYGVPLPLILKYENFIRQDSVDEAARRLRTMVEDKRIVGVEAAIIRNSL